MTALAMGDADGACTGGYFVSLASNGSVAVAGSAVNVLKGGDGKVDAQIWWASVAP